MNNQNRTRMASRRLRRKQGRGSAVATLACLLSVLGCGTETGAAPVSDSREVKSSFAAADDFDSILTEAGDDLIVNNIPGQIGSHSLDVERGTVYLRDGEIIAKVQVTATEVHASMYVRGGGHRKYGVNISTSCEEVGQFYTNKTLEVSDTVVTRCTEEYALVRAMVSIVDLEALSPSDNETPVGDDQTPSSKDSEPQAPGDHDNDKPPSVTPDEPIPTSFEEALDAAGDALIVNLFGGGVGVQSGNLERGTVYMRHKDIVARVAVGALGVRVNTFTRDGGKNRHRVVISTGCELSPPTHKNFEKLEVPSAISARCPAEYPLLVGAAALIDLPETDEEIAEEFGTEPSPEELPTDELSEDAQ